MPIYGELSNYHLQAHWKSVKALQGTLSFDNLRSKLTGNSTQKEQFSLMEPTEQIKRVVDHLKAFEKKLSAHL